MCNNIIAFCGKRGQGKTSAMLSYSAFLKNKEKFKDKENINGKIKTITGLMNEKDKSKVDDVLFSVLEPIDPSSFSSNLKFVTDCVVNSNALTCETGIAVILVTTNVQTKIKENKLRLKSFISFLLFS